MSHTGTCDYNESKVEFEVEEWGGSKQPKDNKLYGPDTHDLTRQRSHRNT